MYIMHILVLYAPLKISPRAISAMQKPQLVIHALDVNYIDMS